MGKIKIQNSTALLIGIVFIFVGVSIGFWEFFEGKKEKVFSDMNILLYESEMPNIIEDDEEPIEEPPVEEPIEEPIEEPEPPVEEKPVEKPKPVTYDYIGILEIPVINLKRGFLGLDSKYNNVRYNVTVVNQSTFPDVENNNLILAGHSGNCSYCYFDKLYKLNIGDEAYVTYKGVKYSYKIVNIYEVEKTGSVVIHRDYSKNVLTLITCTRNSKTSQTIYILEEVVN